MAKLFFVIGAVSLIVSFVMHMFPGLKVGQLPGDFQWKSGNFSIYLPVASSLLISLALSLILFLYGKLFPD